MSFYEWKVEQRDYFYFNRVKKETQTLPHFHGAVELLFCIDGKQPVSISGKTYTLEKGDACFIDCYTVHALPSSEAQLYAIVGDVHFFQPVFSAFGDAIPPCLFRFEKTEFLSLLYTLYQQKKTSEDASTQRNHALVKLLLAELYESVPFAKRKENKQNELVAKILQYAAERYQGDLSLSTLAVQFGYSHTYLSRLLHRYLGVNWNLYVGNIRARAAHALLQNEKNTSVLDIALFCGFDSLNTFYRAYRRIYGNTPLKK